MGEKKNARTSIHCGQCASINRMERASARATIYSPTPTLRPSLGRSKMNRMSRTFICSRKFAIDNVSSASTALFSISFVPTKVEMRYESERKKKGRAILLAVVLRPLTSAGVEEGGGGRGVYKQPRTQATSFHIFLLYQLYMARLLDICTGTLARWFPFPKTSSRRLSFISIREPLADNQGWKLAPRPFVLHSWRVSFVHRFMRLLNIILRVISWAILVAICSLHTRAYHEHMQKLSSVCSISSSSCGDISRFLECRVMTFVMIDKSCCLFDFVFRGKLYKNGAILPSKIKH
jgi:hypothetical protein